jgi:hypothetical protein
MTRIHKRPGIIIRQRIQQLKNGIAECEKALNHLKEKEYWYEVNVISLWANEGEKSLRGFRCEPNKKSHEKQIKEAVELAKKEFMEMNNRSDVQAQITVYMRFPNAYGIVVFRGGGKE